MHHRLPLATCVLVLLGGTILRANDALAPPAAQAPPQVPAQAPAPVKDHWQECLDYTCKTVTEQKPIKKVVYECRDVPFCLHELPKFGHHDCCPVCGCVRYKRVLVKKEVVVGYECVTRCVPEALPPCGPGKGLAPPDAPVPAAAGSYYNGGDLSHLPQAVTPPPQRTILAPPSNPAPQAAIPAPPVPAPPVFR